ncbi:MAG: phenylalanine--tRNA ligase subunit alpha [Alphaproteobacteria bacterium]|nr:phenylalanine--tRNA ligase subunit alpha [Alphaproteobacteria bacterium]
MNELLQELSSAKTPQDLDNIKSKWLGKKSDLKAQMDGLRDLPADVRAAKGAEINKLRAAYEEAIENAKREMQARAINEKLANDNFDMTLPGGGIRSGALHPVSAIEEKCIAAMRRLGFVVATGPEIELPEYNFDLLDIPEHHPARDLQDTFWVEKDKKLLRTHTTSVQSRYMMSLKGDESKLPVRIVSPGRVYRNEAVDASHLAVFHQFEGLMVGHNIKLSELKGVMEFILREIYGESVKIRFKPKFYPYTEPSIGADIDVGDGWKTIVGAGMVSPQVLRNFGFDPKRVSGLAFGFGTSRLAGEFTGATMRELYGMDLRVFKKLAGE